MAMELLDNSSVKDMDSLTVSEEVWRFELSAQPVHCCHAPVLHFGTPSYHSLFRRPVMSRPRPVPCFSSHPVPSLPRF